jgi:predicted phosphodiesterase
MHSTQAAGVRIQFASDLHLEYLERRFPHFRGVEPAEADVLVLAGDVATGTRALDLFADWPCPVVFVPGNHEFYGASVPAVLAEFARRAADFPNVTVLAPGVCEVAGVRFIGCTLWTDYAVFGEAARPAAMYACGEFISDHTAIKAEGNLPFSPGTARALHLAQRHWLESRLAEPFAGKTVVITHHAPHPGSIHPRFATQLTSAAFASDLGSCLGTADLHIHGHTHDSFDYRVGNTRVVANPMGYCRGIKTADSPAQLQRENAAFDSRLILVA